MSKNWEEYRDEKTLLSCSQSNKIQKYNTVKSLVKSIMMMLKSKQERPKVVGSERCEGHRGFLNAGSYAARDGKKRLHACV